MPSIWSEAIKERGNQMLRDKLRKAWNILWLCLWILSCVGGLIEAMGVPAENAGKTGLEGATGFDLLILGFLLLFVQEWRCAIYLTGRYFLQEKEKRSAGKTVFYILFFIIAVILLPLSYRGVNNSILLFELGVLLMPFALGGILWKIVREKCRIPVDSLSAFESFGGMTFSESGDPLDFRED